jgi:RND family efflux transporter MFP subunit
VLLAALNGCGGDVAPAELPPRAIRWERVSGEVPPEQRVISGIVTALDDTRLAFEVAGTVESVDASMGDMVDEGQSLARLDPEPLELAVRESEAASAKADSQRDLARVTLERVRTAYERQAARQHEVDAAAAEYRLRESQYAAALARLNLARRDLRRSVLRAPFRGKISVRQIDPAVKVASGQVVFEMDSERGLRVEVQMPETLIARVNQGDDAEASFPSVDATGARRYPAVVSEVGTRAGVGNAFRVRADLMETPPALRPGMTAEVTFSLPTDEPGLAGLEGFLIPIAAAYAEAGDAFSVFVFDEASSTVRKRPVRVGGVRDNSIAVIDGLSEGEIIATAGVSFLHDGMTVSLFEGAR